MPTVIKHGIDIPKQATCWSCNCIFTYFKHEPYTYTLGDYQVGVTGELYIRCPECNTELAL